FKDKALYTREQANEDYEWIKQVSKKDIQDKGLKQANSSAYLNAVKGQCDLNDLWPTKDKSDSNSTENEIAKVLKEALGDI
ncbi:hypothetical protein, partial [Romboutsia sp.]|uniref:hypothetical protein n=1 Tax=Romboutsia sp. TaxID=1965302 RepID=UPI002BA9A563